MEFPIQHLFLIWNKHLEFYKKLKKLCSAFKILTWSTCCKRPVILTSVVFITIRVCVASIRPVTASSKILSVVVFIKRFPASNNIFHFLKILFLYFFWLFSHFTMFGSSYVLVQMILMRGYSMKCAYSISKFTILFLQLLTCIFQQFTNYLITDCFIGKKSSICTKACKW